MKPTLDTAANGHLTLNFNELSDTYWLALADNLIKLRGFKPLGSPVIGVDEKIHHHFQCAEFSSRLGQLVWALLAFRLSAERCFSTKAIRPAPILTGDSSHSLCGL